MLYQQFHQQLLQRFRQFVGGVLLSVLALVPTLAAAGPFTSLYVFGDSLSDTGNLLGTGATRPFPFAGPYLGDRFSNGPLWVEHFAQGLGLPAQAATPFIYGGNNFAFSGAQTGVYPPLPADQIPGVLAQVGGIWAPTRIAPTDPNALYVVVAGGNDMRDARSLFPTNSAADIAGRQAAAANAINNLGSALFLLSQLGAKNILIATLPDLGLTPEAGLVGAQAASSDATDQFNALIPLLMGAGASFGLNMNLLDIAGLVDQIATNPASFGITDIANPCAGFVFSTGVSCAQSAFSDILHPSALVHSLIGREALRVFGIPEPDTLALFAFAFLALGVARRRSKKSL